MHELLAQIIEQARGAWRFRRYALIAAWIFSLLGWTAVFLLPDVYQAGSRIFVDTKTALTPVLDKLVLDQDVNAQLSLVRQSLLSTPQLEPVAQEIGLIDSRIMTVQQRARILNAMRDRVTLTMSSAQDDGDRSSGKIYALQYKDTSRDRSLQVVEILQNRFIENTLGGKRTGSENAQKFLTDNIRDYEDRLRAAEEKLASFKKQNIGLMPTEQGGYFSRLQTDMDAVTALQSKLAIATSRREELQRQLRGEAPIAAATGIAGTPGVPGGAPGGGGTLSRIKETQARLDELLLRYTDKHPDVVAARENLEELQRRRADEIEALRRGDPNAAAASGASANPVYQSIQLQLNQADVEIASLRRELGDHQARVADLRKMLDTMPQVEAEYARLNRDYDVTKANYTELVQRLEKSRLGEEASNSGSVRFDVIEPPRAPFKPSSPPRSLLILGVLVAGLGAGAGIALLLHQLKPVFTSARSLAEFTGHQVLGTVSMAWADQQNAQRVRSYWRYSAAVIALFVVGAIVLQVSRAGFRLLPPAGA